MKRLYLKMLTCLMGLLPFQAMYCKAEVKVPCLIFSGNAERGHSIDLAKLNRITFGENSMVISSSKDDSRQPVELLYSLFHHLEVGDAVPDGVTVGINAAAADSAPSLYLDSRSKLLYLKSDSDSTYSLGVFDLTGQLLLTCELKSRDAVTLEALLPGSYIAVCSDGQTNLNLKFILN